MNEAMLDALPAYRPSPQQARLLLLGGGRTGDAYVSACLVWLAPGTAPEAVEAALARAVARHEILRTRCVAAAAGAMGPCQVIGEPWIPRVPRLDLRGASPAEARARLETWYRECADDCAAGEGEPPLARMAELDGGRVALAVAVPAHMADAPALLRLVRELADGAPPGDEPLQYVEFAEALFELRETDAYASGRAHWAARWHAPTPAGGLVGGAAADADARFAPATASLRLAGADVDAVARMAAETGTTAEAVLLAAWTALLMRLADAPRVTLGVLCGGRATGEIDDLLGLAGRYVPFSSASGGTVAGLVRAAGDALAGAAAHHPYFEWSDFAAEPAFFPLAFQHEQVPGGAAGESVVVERIESHADRFALKLQATRSDDALDLAVHHDPALFTPAAAERILHRLLRALQSMAAPHAVVNGLDVLPDAERARLLVEPNRTARPYPAAACVHHLFERQARAAPDAPAVVCAGAALTYAELDGRANRLARVLRARGVGPERCVALAMDATAELVVAMLATLKAGGAYLPLDAEYPAERIGFMLRDSGAVLVLADAGWAERLPGDVPVLAMDVARAGLAVEDAAPLGVASSPDQLAYLIYTSGSTGMPKAVMVPHRGVVNYLSWCTEAYGIADTDGALVTSSAAFDLTVTSLWGPLSCGRTARLAEGGRAVVRLGEAWAAAGGPLLLKMTPVEVSLAARVLAEHDREDRRGVAVIGGEALYADAVAALWTRAPSLRVFNEYGPTETVVGCCVHEVSAPAAGTGAVPIGRPIANTSIYLLDARLQPVPMGVAGEIHIGGHGVARGYAGRPALTAGRFVPDPFGSETGARMYRTGDLARWSDAGVLEYLGRSDHQVKVNGHRVELGEVEAVLRSPGWVRDAVATVREEGDARFLAAYVVLDDGAPEGWEDALRADCARHMPPWMVPARLVRIPALPLAASGKVDRTALPSPEAVRGRGHAGVQPPATELEAAVAAVWREALGAAQVGVEANFFDVGGYSLLMFQVHDKLQTALGRTISVVDLFAFPTVRALARHLEHGGEAPAPALEPGVAAARQRAVRARRARMAPQAVDDGRNP